MRRLAALMRSCVMQTAPARYFDGGVSADQALRSYKWSYIRLAALHLRWQNLWSYWAIAVVPTLLGRTISLLKPAENIAIFPFYAPRVVQMVVLYDESFSSLFVPQTRYLLPPKTHSNGSCAALWVKFHSKIVKDARPSASRSYIQ